MRQYLTRREIAERYPVSFSTLAHLAVEGRGPPYSIVGKKAIYDAIKVEQWIDSQQVDLSAKTGHNPPISPSTTPPSTSADLPANLNGFLHRASEYNLRSAGSRTTNSVPFSPLFIRSVSATDRVHTAQKRQNRVHACFH